MLDLNANAASETCRGTNTLALAFNARPRRKRFAVRAYRFDHLGNTELLQLLASLVSEGRENTTRTIAAIAEVDERKLYLPAGYPSMLAYCIGELGLSDDAALKRIQVARATQDFPALLEMLADGRLHLTGARMVVPYLTPENRDELLGAVTRQTRAEIERLIAERFTATDLLTVPSFSSSEYEHASGYVQNPDHDSFIESSAQSEGQSPEPQHAPGHVANAPTTSLAPRRIPLHLLPATHDKIRYAKELLGHELQSGDDAQVVDRALREMIVRLERRKDRQQLPRRRRKATTNPRHTPEHVKQTVWKRDRGQCTFVGDTGHRCGTRKFLEFDHIEAVARGGDATVENLRLRCRAHNQYEAERTFGSGFMERKREQARIRKEHARDVLSGLRELGFRLDEARRAADYSATLGDVSLEERMRAALQFACPRRPSVASTA